VSVCVCVCVCVRAHSNNPKCAKVTPSAFRCQMPTLPSRSQHGIIARSHRLPPPAPPPPPPAPPPTPPLTPPPAAVAIAAAAPGAARLSRHTAHVASVPSPTLSPSHSPSAPSAGSSSIVLLLKAAYSRRRRTGPLRGGDACAPEMSATNLISESLNGGSRRLAATRSPCKVAGRRVVLRYCQGKGNFEFETIGWVPTPTS